MATVSERTKLLENNITKFEIYPNKGGSPINLLGNGGYDLYYYENILSPTVEVEISLTTSGHDADSDDGSGSKISFVDKINSGSGEKIFLEFEDGMKQKISFTTDDNALFVNKTQKLPEINKNAGYTFHLCTKEFLGNEQVRVLERYDGKISDSVRKIFQTILKTNKQLDIETTQNKFSFIGTNKKPFWTITWLSKKSIPDGSNTLGATAGYFFFETRRGFKYKSIEKLFEKPKVYKKLIFNNSVSNVIPLGYDGKILKYNSSDTGNLKEQMKMGTYTSTMNQFSSFESTYNCNPVNLDLQSKGINFTGTEWGKDVNSIFSSGAITRIYSGNLSLGNLKSVDESKETDHDKETTTPQSNSRYNQVFKYELSIEIAGDFSLEAGEVIYCDFPESSSKETSVPNQRLSGFYLIAGLCHHIEPHRTITSLQLVRDSFGRAPMSSSSITGTSSPSVQKVSDTSSAQRQSTNSQVDENGLTAEERQLLEDERSIPQRQAAAAASEPSTDIKYADDGYPSEVTNADILDEDEFRAQNEFR